MWSAWFDRVDIYLSPSHALLRQRGQPVVVLERAELSTQACLDQLLEQAGVAISAQRVRKLGFRFALGAGLCPPVAFDVPSGLRNRAELLILGRSAAAEKIGLATSEVACESVLGAHGLVAALPLAELQGIQDWVAQQNGDLIAVRPAWVLACSSALARRQSVQVLRLAEPGQISLIGQGLSDKSTHALSVPLALQTDTTALENRWLATHGLPSTAVMSIRFQTQPTGSPASSTAGLPTDWAGHWELG